MKKYINIGIISLLIIGLSAIIWINFKEVRPRRKNLGIKFWILKKENINSILTVWSDLDSAKILGITNEINDGLEHIDIKGLKKSKFHSFENSFLDGEDVDSTIVNIPKRKTFFTNLASKVKAKGVLSNYIIREVVETYQSYKAGAIFPEVWFRRPFIHFSYEFLDDYLPNSNQYIQKNNFVLGGDVYFKRYPNEIKLLGRPIEELEMYMGAIPIEYAREVLKHKPFFENGQYRQEAKVFYEIMEDISNQKVEAFVIELN